jgi:hypothetical protein
LDQQPILKLSDYLQPTSPDGSGGSGTGGVSSNVAAFPANQTALDSGIGGFSIEDTAANVSAQLDALNADANINSIVLTDSGNPVLTLTATQAVQDAAALGVIANANYGIAISDTAANVSAAFDTLGASVPVESITLADVGMPTLSLSVAQTLNAAGALAKITNASYSVAVSDAAANVASHIDALNVDARIGSLTLTDSGTPTLALTVAQVLADTAALAAITNAGYAIAVHGPAGDILANQTALGASAHIGSTNVVDNATNIVANLAALDADAQITTITVVDTAANILANSAVLDADPRVTARVVIDTAANVLGLGAGPMPTQVSDTAVNVAANIDALNAATSLTSIMLTDSGTPSLTLTVAQALGDTTALAKIANATYVVAVADTAINVSANIDALNTYGPLGAITLTDSGTPTLALTVAQALGDATALNAIANTSYASAVTGTAADVSANIDALNADARLSSITLTDSGTPVLTLTVVQTLGDTAALAKIANPGYAVALSDTAAAISANFDALNADAAISSITLTDAGMPTLHLTATQALNDLAAQAKIGNSSYAISVTDSAANLLANAAALGANAHVTSLVAIDTAANILANGTALANATVGSAIVADTAANVVASISALDSDGIVKRIELTDSGTPTLGLTVGQLLGNGKVLRDIVNANFQVAISDSAANVSGSLDILAGYGAIASVTLTDGGTPTLTLGVIQALDNRAFIGKITNSAIKFAIADTTTAIATGLNALNTDNRVDTITLTDSATPVLSLTRDQVINDSGVLSKVANSSFAVAITDDTIANVLTYGAALNANPKVTAIDVTDSVLNVAANRAALGTVPKISITATGTAAEIAANLDVLNDNTSITSIEPIPAGAVNLRLTAAQALADGDTIGKIDAFVNVAVVDSAANVSANLDLLAAKWQVQSITLTDSGTPTFTLGAAQLSSDMSGLNKITNATYAIAVSDTVANIVNNYFYPISGDAKVISIAVVDTAANILNGSGDLGFLMGIEPRFSAVKVSDTAAEIVANLAALSADGQITAIVVVDTAADVAANIDTLNTVRLLDSITLTDSGSPTLNLTAAQVANDKAALDAISNPNVRLMVSDTAANVAANLDALNADPRVSAITLTDLARRRLRFRSPRRSAIRQRWRRSATQALVWRSAVPPPI